jgi:hypothetical protein
MSTYKRKEPRFLGLAPSAFDYTPNFRANFLEILPERYLLASLSVEELLPDDCKPILTLLLPIGPGRNYSLRTISSRSRLSIESKRLGDS